MPRQGLKALFLQHLQNRNYRMQSPFCKMKVSLHVLRFLSVWIILNTAAQALDEGTVNAIANTNCANFLSSEQIPKAIASSNVSEAHINTTDIIAVGAPLCPPWYRMTADGQCEQGENFNYLLNFQEHTQQTWLQTFYCMTTSKENQTTRTDVIGSCLYSFDVRDSTYYPLPCNVSQLNDYMCADLNREGQLCGRCKEGFAPTVYSYTLSCVKCTDYRLNWLKYVAVAFVPLTLFCIFVCVFHISATSSYLHGFIFYCQIVSMPTIVRMAQNTNGYKESGSSERVGGQTYVSLISVWNLDFFRGVNKPFCIHPNMTVVQALALDYVIALYPLILIIITFMLVLLYGKNYTVVVTLWKPFKIVLRPFLRNLNIETSLIESFATLYLLSVMKIQSVTLDLLAPTSLYYADGRISDKLYLYLAGDVEYFGVEHLPYALLALVLFSIFVIFPAIIFFLYPCKLFQTCLNKVHCNFHVLRTFMDVFQGHYKDGTNNTRDYRYFSGIFFVTRLILVASFVLLNSLYSFLIFGTILTVLGFTVATLHPQRTQLHYAFDCIILMLLSVLLFSVIGYFIGPHSSIPSTVSKLFGYIALVLPLLYIKCLVGYWTVVKKKVPQRLGRTVWTFITKVIFVKNNEGEYQHLIFHAT